MSDPPSHLAAFLAELKRRRVFRVAAVYAGVAFVIIQLADYAFEQFNVSSEFAQKHGCLDGKYIQCKAYTQRVLELSMTVPLICPLKNQEERCNFSGKGCDHYWIDPFSEDLDYRLCETFSQWFWQQRETEKL